ncbi:MAG: hypothetical protein NTU53_05600 [Planctomycetota bacterium]|nr:hypothetical protein [Planctomycetota bacterium]
MKAEKTAIRILVATAVLLIAAIVMLPKPATGQAVSLKQGDYVVATHKVSSGGDAIYIVDTRIGVIGLFVHDAQSRSVQLKALRPLADAFDADR